MILVALSAFVSVRGDTFTDNGGFYIHCKNGDIVSAAGTDINNPGAFCPSGVTCLDDTGNGCTGESWATLNTDIKCLQSSAEQGYNMLAFLMVGSKLYFAAACSQAGCRQGSRFRQPSLLMVVA